MKSLFQYLLLIGLLLTVTPLLHAQDQPDATQVRLFEQAAPQAVVIRADQGRLQFFAGDAPNVLAELAPNEAATIRRRGEEVCVILDDFSFFALSLRLVPEEEALLRIEVTDGAVREEPRSYPGRLLLDVDPSDRPALRLVNEIPLEAYTDVEAQQPRQEPTEPTVTEAPTFHPFAKTAAEKPTKPSPRTKRTYTRRRIGW